MSSTPATPPPPFTDPGSPSIGFMIAATALVFIMTPGVGLLYSGLSRSKNAGSIFMACMLAMAVVTVQWVLFGFSLAFSETGSAVIGNFAWGGFTNVGIPAIPVVAVAIPGVLFALYQMQFATVTAALIFGSVTERIRLIPTTVFVFLWTTIVYDPVAYWTWADRGWIRNMACLSTTALDQTPCGIGSFDYAGGGPVHIASGFAGLAYCLIIGKRRGAAVGEHSGEFRSHNIPNVILGTALLWFGWFGFNGALALAATPRAVMAGTVTTVAAAAAALSWAFVDTIRTGKVSAVGFCSGAIAGLVAITPASGFVAPWAAIVIGLVAGVACNYATYIKNVFGFDDTLDAWGVHAVGGFLGNVLTGIFAQKWIGLLDGTAINGGWVDGNWVQVGYQVGGSVAIAAWSFFVSFVLLYAIDKIPGLKPALGEESYAFASFNGIGATDSSATMIGVEKKDMVPSIVHVTGEA
ncbi:ammonium transporter [Polyrhizophydium stewartii]|uniref:Ammonium transporter n=1 Tax=Polyrhizophydium stewartii TaxID=2732419 RepID=A0ABR4NAJ1_9FUNG